MEPFVPPLLTEEEEARYQAWLAKRREEIEADYEAEYGEGSECDECDGMGVKAPAYWSDDGAAEDCPKCSGAGRLYGQNDEEGTL